MDGRTMMEGSATWMKSAAWRLWSKDETSLRSAFVLASCQSTRCSMQGRRRGSAFKYRTPPPPQQCDGAPRGAAQPPPY
jgi:hypothetical protein